ncbi:MAG: AAA family ATPase [Candidatus Thiodiazotropha sp. (ex Lucinoma borealis)]|nr:AAA family ATPase [Candidatus Thiodiazotropha sp. (ex Lucinoma borealis)]
MSGNWKWPGARWWKFDFHTHTPASDDYGKGPDHYQLKQRTPGEWLLDFMRAEIDCVAVTDHNSGEWIDPLKSELDSMKENPPEGYRPLYLFPGVEITVNGGVHILAVFGPESTTGDITALLGAVGFHGTRGKSNDCTTKSVKEVITEIVEYGGLPIPAHVDGPSGLFSEQTGNTLAQTLESQITAIELIDTNNQKPQLVLDNKLEWAEVIGSDSHHPNTVGSRLSWIKMTRPNLDGLRLALLDGPLSVKRSDTFASDPNAHGNILIEGLSVENARYIGRPSALELKLNPWLNTLIGGRGTGKSTLLEFMRIALRREAELPDGIAEDFVKYKKIAESRNDDGLLEAEATLTVAYRKDDARFRVRWSVGADKREIVEETGSDVWTQVDGDVRQRFPVRIYSQKQIFELAGQPLALLQIVDETERVDRGEWIEQWREEEARFLSLRAQCREIAAGLSEESRVKGELDDVKRRLEVFEKVGHADVLKEYQHRIRQQSAVTTWEEEWTGYGDRLRQLAAEFTVPELEEGVLNKHDDTTEQLDHAMGTVRKRTEGIAKSVLGLASEADAVKKEWEQGKNGSAWQQKVTNAVGRYEQLLTRLQDEDAGDPAEYGKLVQHRQALESKLDEYQKRKGKLTGLRSTANESLEQLKALRKKLSERRKSFLDDVLDQNPYVKVELVPFGAKELTESDLRRLLGREDGGFEKDIGGINTGGLLGRIYEGYPGERTVEELQTTLDEVKEHLHQLATGMEVEVQDRRFAGYMQKIAPESLDRLDAWFPEDSLHVEYSTSADGQNLRPLHQGSPGQKTAALLAFLLSYGNEPIILDQPEDDLDNHLIYDLIVKQLREIKRNRQIVIVTHNANIVVNGDAELVVSLDARGGQTRKISEGSLQEKTVREEVCRVMEGGREAFERRYRRISGK